MFLFSSLTQAKDEEQEAKELMGDKMQSQIEAVQFKQTKLEKTVDDLKDKVQVE